MPLTERLSTGVGPGIGYVRAEADGRDTDLYGWQLGADLDYRVGRVYFGLGARWLDTVRKTMPPGRGGTENWLVQAKGGINFDAAGFSAGSRGYLVVRTQSRPPLTRTPPDTTPPHASAASSNSL